MSQKSSHGSCETDCRCRVRPWSVRAWRRLGTPVHCGLSCAMEPSSRGVVSMRLKSFFVAAIAAIAIPIAASAEPYVVVGGNLEQVRVLDRGTIRASGTTRLAWIYIICADPLPDRGVYWTVRNEYDCSIERYRTVFVQVKDEAGYAVRDSGTQTTPWFEVTPQSAGAGELKDVCSSTPVGTVMATPSSVADLVTWWRQRMKTLEYRSMVNR